MKQVILLITVVLLGCAKPNQPKTINPNILMKVDKEFSDYSKSSGMHDAFESYIAEEGVIFRPNSFPIEGKSNVVNRLRQRSDTSIVLTWEPMFAKMAMSGDLGYTYGTYLVSSNQGDSIGVGTYITIWEEQSDGGWKFVFDAGNEGLKQETE